MSTFDTIRRESAVQGFDFWMDYHGVPGRQRRVERRELRAGLDEAAGHGGMRQALRDVGSLRERAEALAEPYSHRPRWAVGAFAAVPVFAALLYGWLFSSIAFVEGVVASGVTGREVRSSDVLPWLGTEFTATVEPGGGGLSVGSGLPWALLVLPLLVFLLVARPWRLVTGRGSRAAAGAH
ncbi:MAG: hypothetical protein LWW86_00030 [Micrococcales bacterium]|nr:hypothetical protein [Micrococcales bacterium]